MRGVDVMGAVLKFRRDSKNVSRLLKKKKSKHIEEMVYGQIVIFPGVRIERHTQDYLIDELENDLDNDTKNAG